MVQEIKEHFYRTTLFTFGNLFSYIPRFRTTDQWSVGFLPVRYVSNVAVTISCSHYRLADLEYLKEEHEILANQSGGDAWWGSDAPPPWGLPDAATQLPQNLDHLFGFKLGIKICIRI